MRLIKKNQTRAKVRFFFIETHCRGAFCEAIRWIKRWPYLGQFSQVFDRLLLGEARQRFPPFKFQPVELPVCFPMLSTQRFRSLSGWHEIVHKPHARIHSGSDL